MVTGAAGFIGSHLVEQLLIEGWTVIALDDLSTGNLDNLSIALKNEHFHFVKADVTKLEQIDPLLFKDLDCVFHLAGKKMAFSVKFPREDLYANVTGTLNMLILAAEHGVKRFIISSTIAVYGDPEKPPSNESSAIVPTTPYGVSKFAAEEYCRLWFRQHKLPVVVLRYASVFGPRQAVNVGAVTVFLSKILNDEFITVYGDGSFTRPFTYVGDVVRANILAATAETKTVLGETFNVGSNRSVSIMELINTLGLKLNKKPKINFVPPRLGELQHMAADIGKIRKVLKFETAFSFEEGIARTVDYYAKK